MILFIAEKIYYLFRNAANKGFSIVLNQEKLLRQMCPINQIALRMSQHQPMWVTIMLNS